MRQHPAQLSFGKILGDACLRQHGDAQVERGQVPDHTDAVEQESTTDRGLDRFVPMVLRPWTSMTRARTARNDLQLAFDRCKGKCEKALTS